MRTLSRFLILMVLLLAASCQKDEVAPPALSSEDTEKVAFRDFTAEQLYAILDAMETEINAWMDAGELNANTGDRLLDKVSIMRSLVDDGRLSSAERALSRSFLQYVNRLYAEGKLTKSQRQSLDDMAHGILPEGDEGLVYDPSGKAYPWKRMADGRKWLTVNLDYWDGQAGNAWHYNAAQSEPYPGYGMLYDWAAATAACGNAFGPGWRTPSKADWDNLIGQYDPNWDRGEEYFSSAAPYGYLILGGDSGFDALLGGYRSFLGNYYNLEAYGYCWSGTEEDMQSAWHYTFHSNNGVLIRSYNDKLNGFSCRCVQD